MRLVSFRWPGVARSTAYGRRSAAQRRSIEETYRKLADVEHVLLRPELNIGSCVLDKHPDLWVVDEATHKMKQGDLTFCPGMYKIFDEILVNAADNKVRDHTMTRVEVEFGKDGISVMNDGTSIPVQLHKEYGVYVPELIFGTMRTGSNYNDSEEKFTGGRNGLGAKLTNIFSTEFTVEAYDSEQNLLYVQTWKDNMQTRGEPIITSKKQKNSYTRITFKPDYKRFSMAALDNDMQMLITKRVYDLAGTVKVNVTLNGEKIPKMTFAEYCRMYPVERPLYHRINDNWEVCFAPSNGVHHQVSFVNGIWTIRGGKHVDALVDQVTAEARRSITDVKFTVRDARRYMWCFVNSRIANPSFDSQTKEKLTATVSRTTCRLGDFAVKAAEKLLTTPLSELKAAEATKEINRNLRQAKRPSKLEDAHKVGKDSAKCTLIITEGDSARALAKAGIAALPAAERDYWGILPIRGKVLNVRQANEETIFQNKEVVTLMWALGLQKGAKYSSASELRYGHLMLMTDQDADGSHIKGLIINLIDFLAPGLLGAKGFLREFITPIVKATAQGKRQEFFSVAEFREWQNRLPGAATAVKYYKGLATSSAAEGREYFKALEKHVLEFKPCSETDRESICLAFHKEHLPERKTWIENHQTALIENTFEGTKYAQLKNRTISEFIHRELITFSYADCVRSIPSVIDGLKPSQRKVLWAALKLRKDKEVKVTELAGKVIEKMAYHHGDSSLHGTIVAMAQDFVGAGNVNLLEPIGQFGTRLRGGDDHGAARYLSTMASPLVRKLFPEADDPLLALEEDDGKQVEPKYLVPIIPLLLANGSCGIGTGYATNIPAFDPRDLVRNIRALLRKETVLKPLVPYYRGFTGKVERLLDRDQPTWMTYGTVQVKGTLARVTELPAGLWTDVYTETLHELKEKNVITEFRNACTTETVLYEITLSKSVADLLAAMSSEVYTTLKLSNSVTLNPTAFDARGRLKRFPSLNEMQREFFACRLELYRKRREYQICRLEEALCELENKIRFVKDVNDGKVHLKRKKAEVEMQLRELGYKELSGNDDGKFGYLFGIRALQFTHDSISKWEAGHAATIKRLEDLRAATPESIWESELTEFIEAWEAGNTR